MLSEVFTARKRRRSPYSLLSLEVLRDSRLVFGVHEVMLASNNGRRRLSHYSYSRIKLTRTLEANEHKWDVCAYNEFWMKVRVILVLVYVANAGSYFSALVLMAIGLTLKLPLLGCHCVGRELRGMPVQDWSGVSGPGQGRGGCVGQTTSSLAYMD